MDKDNHNYGLVLRNWRFYSENNAPIIEGDKKTLHTMA